jgi:thiamine-phosphate pyrophosphorylase
VTSPISSNSLFYGILDSSWVSPHQWVAKCRDLVNGGADLIQIRAKKETSDERRALLESILPLFTGSPVPLIVNDDIELCLRYPHLGLHVGQDDLDASEARSRLGPDRILGLSTHSEAQAEGAIALGPDILSYFAVGPVFTTPTKPDYIPVGLELVQHVSQLASPLPFYCIGGITRHNLLRVKAAGGRRIVIVSDVLSAADTEQAVRSAKAELIS